MAGIQPFVATRFNARFNSELSQLLTPPYDVIDKNMQQQFYDVHPSNIVRVDFGKDLPGDNEYENRYTRAGAIWQQWKTEGVIVEEPKKAFYVYEQEFTIPGGKTFRRRGFFAAVKLEDFSEGGIRAHEHTFDGPKADRFRLMRATNSNLSSVFCLYDDAQMKVDALLEQGIAGEKAIEATFDGVTQRIWVLSKPSVVQALIKLMGPQTLFIADGHHRYETCLLYRDEMRSALGKKNGRQPYDYAMIYMNNIHDDGLIILPTHRVLSKETMMGVETEEVFEDLAEHFDCQKLKINLEEPESEALRLTAMLEEAGKKAVSFVMLLPRGNACLMTLKAAVDVNELIDNEQTPREIKELDVSILHQHIINQVWLGNPEIELDDQDVKYVKDAAEVLRLMKSCKYAVSFLVNPTKIEQVCNIAKLGMRMPHKSTYFYPKLVTGLVMRDMNAPW